MKSILVIAALYLAAPAFAQQAPTVRERIVPRITPAEPPAVSLEAKPETFKESGTLLKCTNDPEAAKAGNRDLTCTEVKNPETDKRPRDYGRVKKYPATPA